MIYDSSNSKEDFRWVRFADLFSVPIRNGVYVPKDKRGIGYNMLNMGELFAYPRVPDMEMERVQLSDREIEMSLLEVGDLLFARRSLVLSGAGKCSIYVGKAGTTTFESSIIRVRLNKEIAYPEYYFYFFNSQPGRFAIESIAEQVAVAGIRGSDLKEIEVPYPALSEQREIAHILGALDDKIELNRRMNATLEATARAIFQSWFVDFDPVRAKAEGRQPEGMDAETAALFPDSFEESELGPIPKGWGVKPLDRIANFQNGLALQKFPPESNRFLPVIKIRELRQGYVDENSDKASPNIRESCIVYDGDVLFSWSGSLLVDVWCGGMGALNQHLFKVTSIEYPKWFYLQWTQHHLEEFIGVAADKATTMGHIQRQHLSSALTVVPPSTELAQLDMFISPLIEQMIQTRLESRTLAETRDALLPRLISGEVRVGEIERFG